MADENAPAAAPTTAAEAPAVPEDTSISVTLSKPIPVYAEKVSVIKFRKPNGGDIIRVGNPVLFDPISDPPRISHDAARMTAMMARLANIPTSSFDFMDPQDLVSCFWSLTPFFMPAPGKV